MKKQVLRCLQAPFRKPRQKGLVSALFSMAIALLVMATGGIAQSNGAPQPLTPKTLAPKPPNTVNRLLPDQWVIAPKKIDTASIYLDGRALFDVGAPTVENQHPAEIRAQEIQRRLNRVTDDILTNGNAATPPEVEVTLDTPSNLPVIFTGGQLMMTVTSADAQLGGQATPNDRAFDLAEILTRAFERHQQERQGSFFRKQAKVTAGILGAAGLLTWWARRWSRQLQKRQKRLANAKTQLGQERGHHPLVEVPLADMPFIGPTLSTSANPVFNALKARLDNRQKRKITEALLGSLVIFQIGLWLGSGLWILALFPHSRWLTTLLIQWIRVPATILLLCGLAYLAVRLSSLVIDKVGLTLQEGVQWAPQQSQRLSLRFSTLSQVAKGVAGSLIFAVTVLVALTLTGVEIAPLLAGAGIIGVGISLAAQGLIKDLIHGFLILTEDHFGIGDVISVNEFTGTVEYINLRITQLRNSEGRLITIPNSQINIVQNLSMDWAQVDFSITVAANTNVTEALALLKATATELAQEDQWQQFILEPPDVLGVEALDHKGTTLRLLLKTQPLKQWTVARELRQRVKYAFEAAGLAMGLPRKQVAVQFETSEVTEE